MTHLPWVCADPRDDRSNLSRPFRMIVILFERLMSTGSRSDIPFLLAGARMIGQMFDDLPSCFIQSHPPVSISHIYVYIGTATVRWLASSHQRSGAVSTHLSVLTLDIVGLHVFYVYLEPRHDPCFGAKTWSFMSFPIKTEVMSGF